MFVTIHRTVELFWNTHSNFLLLFDHKLHLLKTYHLYAIFISNPSHLLKFLHQSGSLMMYLIWSFILKQYYKFTDYMQIVRS
uniref:Uncharacterized protein n=1 Tax=Rhizophora mucronata TaxID=61149 RepID=A0A2P2NW33_RHIMU